MDVRAANRDYDYDHEHHHEHAGDHFQYFGTESFAFAYQCPNSCSIPVTGDVIVVLGF